MKKAILLSGVILIFTLNIRAQEKVGFSNPDAIDPLLEYRLPDWGYSNFSLDFSMNGGSRNRVFSEDREDTSQDVDFIIRPNYRLYRQSEKRIFSLHSDLLLRYDYRRDEDNPEGDVQKRNIFDSEIGFDVDWREYIAPKIFLLINENARFQYDFASLERREDAVPEGEEESVDRFFSSGTQAGIGFGRVRNVNPMIRALRLSERYGAIDSESGLVNGDIKAAAEVFTKFGGYQRRYDRPEKYFWEAMDQVVGGAISGLEPFDLFYLSDVLNENIGRRLQGWDIAGGGQFSYSNILSRYEDTIDPPAPDFQRSYYSNKSAGIFLQGRWYNNVSLSHQVGFNGNIDRMYPLESDAHQKWRMSAVAEFSWLWNLTDRFLLDTRIQNRYLTSKSDTDLFEEERSWVNSLLVNSYLLYFIENSFGLTTRLGYGLTHRGDTESEASFNSRTSSFSINAGFRYYFSRNLY